MIATGILFAILRNSKADSILDLYHGVTFEYLINCLFSARDSSTLDIFYVCVWQPIDERDSWGDRLGTTKVVTDEGCEQTLTLR